MSSELGLLNAANGREPGAHIFEAKYIGSAVQGKDESAALMQRFSHSGAYRCCCGRDPKDLRDSKDLRDLKMKTALGGPPMTEALRR